MGVPVVMPSKTPESSSILSPSCRWVTMRLCPGRRRAISFCKKASSKATPAGQPSIITPNPRPWLSPKVLILKLLPKEFPANVDDFSWVLISCSSCWSVGGLGVASSLAASIGGLSGYFSLALKGYLCPCIFATLLMH